MSSPPGISILIPFEGAVRLWIDALTESEVERLWDWVASRPELVDLVAHALWVAEEARAA